MEKELDIFCEDEQVVVEKPQPVIASEQTLARIVDLENAIAVLESQKSKLQETYDEIKKGLMEGMKANGLTKFQSEKLSISYTPEGVTTKLDGKKLQELDAELYAKCLTETTRKEMIRITIRKEKK